MTDQPNPNPEPVDPLAMFSYRGHLGRGGFFGGLLIEVLLILVGLVVFAHAMNPTAVAAGLSYSSSSFRSSFGSIR